MIQASSTEAGDTGSALDELIEGELLDQACAVLRELILARDITFPCCVLPTDQGDWMLLGFWDGGRPASSCCLYIRTKLASPGPDGQTHQLRLLAGKSCVTPSSAAGGALRTSMLRTKMRGLLLLA